MKIEKDFDLRKYLKEGKLTESWIDPNLEARNSPLFNKLVPGSGVSDTVEGEVLRAINRIIYRYYNDGDYYDKGYGTETAGPAQAYLVGGGHEMARHLKSIFDKYENTSLGEDSKLYEATIEKALEEILTWVESKKGKYTPNTEDMLKYDARFEDDEYGEDDEYDMDYWDEEDEDELYESKADKINENGDEDIEKSAAIEKYFKLDPPIDNIKDLVLTAIEVARKYDFNPDNIADVAEYIYMKDNVSE